MSPRRRLMAALLASAALPGCGFALKRPPQLQLRRVNLRGFAARSPMGDELRRQLRASPGAELAESMARADVVLEALEDAREQVVAGSTAFGQVRELTLRTRLRFRAYTPAGHELIPVTELTLSRDMSYSETAALGKEYEAELMFRTMQGDIASQVLRRLAVLTPESVAAAARAAAASAVPVEGAASAAAPAAPASR